VPGYGHFDSKNPLRDRHNNRLSVKCLGESFDGEATAPNEIANAPAYRMSESGHSHHSRLPDVASEFHAAGYVPLPTECRSRPLAGWLRQALSRQARSAREARQTLAAGRRLAARFRTV
jgi:hypothetical protein